MLLPLLSHSDRTAAVAFRDDRRLRVDAFLADVAALAARLPMRAHVVNLCVDRYSFAVGFAAALVRGQVNLLPPGAAPELLRELAESYPDLYALTDAPVPDCPLETVEVGQAGAAQAQAAMPAFESEQLAAIAFTSGSTGKPASHPKRWGALVRGAQAEARAMELGDTAAATVVGTVPAQHMYGLESTVMLALHNGFGLQARRPFYPADIRKALEQVPAGRVLVTTPVHLRALLEEEQKLPALRLIVCATAPLPVALAAEAERRYAAPLLEVYGFTEAGQVATRRTAMTVEWRTMPGVRIRCDERGVWFGGGHVEVEALASDVIEPLDAQRFVLHGRSADMVNVAGKRTSLAYLNHQLASIPGIEDGVYFLPEDSGEAVTRLLAFVVAPGLTPEAVLSALRARLDPVFLPRPLYFVPALPRNATGKLPREALERLAAACAAPKPGPGCPCQ
jgi:acyl-coenzyme A synthetase/AMP-(fatty) acid ligase